MNKPYKILYVEKVFNEFSEIPSKISIEILRGIQHLSSFPLMGKLLESNYWKGYQIVIEGYRVFYTVNHEKKFLTVYQSASSNDMRD
jgi:mRNA-degrading endonuclease RelE of RelBE toxin-antitoxin system